jgi:phosphate transport system permease protein
MTTTDLAAPITRSRPRWGERAIVFALFLTATISVLVTIGIVAVLAAETISFFREVNLFRFLTGTRWAPQTGEADAYGVLPLLNGTLLIAVGSLAVGLPLGLATAIYLSEYASVRVRNVVKPVLEMLAGVPTVVFGFFALTFVTPNLLRPIFGSQVFIFNAASGAVVVGLMILPMIASLSEDAMRAVPQSLREGAYGMGASRRTVAVRVVLPAALSGIAASVILAISRAVGETMAVTIAAGNTPNVTFDFFESIQTLTAYIAQVVQGETAAGTTTYRSLFAVGSTLFVITLAMNIISNQLVRRFRQEYQ